MKDLIHGIFWKIFSCACFAGMNATVRFLTGGSPLDLHNPIPVYTIMFYQNLIGVLLLIAIIGRDLMGQQHNTIVKHKTMHFFRIMLAALGIALWYISLKYIPITQVVALSFTGPIFTIIGAVLFLREKFPIKKWIAVGLSLSGTFLINWPKNDIGAQFNIGWYALLPLLSALVFAIDKLLTKRLIELGESPKILALYLLGGMIPFCLIPAVAYGWVTPSVNHIPWLALLGILAAAAHYSFGRAYVYAEITSLMPFGASKILLCAIVSYYAFAELPKTINMWVGVLILTISTILLSSLEHGKQKSKTQDKPVAI